MASDAVSGAYNVDLNVSKLLDSTSVLASGVTKLNNNANSINTISNSIKSNWTNEYSTNSDISTSLEKIKECLDNYNTIIEPVLTKFTETMNILAIAHQSTGQKIFEASGE